MLRRLVILFVLAFLFVLYFSADFLIEWNISKKYKKTDEIIKSYFKDFKAYTVEGFLKDLPKYQESFNQYNVTSPITFMAVFDKNWKILAKFNAGTFNVQTSKNLENAISKEMKESSFKKLVDQALFAKPIFFYKQHIKLDSGEINLVSVYDSEILNKEFLNKKMKLRVLIVLFGILLYLFYKTLSFIFQNRGQLNSNHDSLEDLVGKKKTFKFKTKKEGSLKKDFYQQKGSFFESGELDLSVRASVEEEAIEEVEVEPIDEEVLKQWNFNEKSEAIGLGTLEDIRKNYQQLKSLVEKNDLHTYLNHIKGAEFSLNSYKSFIIRLFKTVYYSNSDKMVFYHLNSEENAYNERFSIEKDRVTIYHLAEQGVENSSLFRGSKLFLDLSKKGDEIKRGFFYLETYRNCIYFPIMTSRKDKVEGILKVVSATEIWKNQIIATQLFLKTLFLYE